MNIRQTSEAIRTGGKPKILISEFIDNFNKSGIDERIRLIADPPVDLPKKHLQAYLAAVVDFLCHRDKIEIPKWTKEIYLTEPFFYGGEKLKAILISESPVAFRRRNLFVSSNAVMRV